jgi:geranylgeranyl diphosphate synthase, type II
MATKIRAGKSPFEKYLKQKGLLAEKGLKRYVSDLKNAPPFLKEAMEYSLMAGGKRLRPILVFATAEAFGKKAQDVLPCACAVEMLHTYSLIHDDLPSLDNDSLRRGKPTSHKVFGEPAAILAGDALLTYAFEVLSKNSEIKAVGPKRTLSAIAVLSRAAGAQGMVGGQVCDVFAEGILERNFKRFKDIPRYKGTKSLRDFVPGKKTPDSETVLKYIHKNKTAALLQASIEMGAILAGASDRNLVHVRKFGLEIGNAFQTVDDILDIIADKKKLGKRGSDRENQKLTSVAIYGLEKSRKIALNQIESAIRSLNKISGVSKSKLDILRSIAIFIMERAY